MSTNTYVELDTKTLVSVAQGITFTNIPQGYTDLVLVLSLISKTAGNDIRFRVGNGSIDSGSNYSATFITGDGSTRNSDRVTDSTFVPQMRLVATTTSPATFIFNFQNYSNTTTSKTIISRNSSTSSEVGASIGLWRSNSAINQIYVYEDGNTSPQQFDVGTTATLYGVKAWASETTPKATGGYVSQDSAYWYHAFPFSSTFTPNQSLTADILCVAGGGGGGYFEGGGGAGGLLTFTSQSLTATNYAITVGAGGAGDSNIGGSAPNGTNSQFASLTAAVGGGGGGSFQNNGDNDGAAGGSGGGAGGADTAGAIGTGGAGTSGQGFAGGNGTARDTYHAGGGGGGAGGAGQSAVNADEPGNGGIGATSSLINAIGAATALGEFSGGNYYFAGGGGGGANSGGIKILDNGGAGGGGNGGYGPTNQRGTDGLVSTGGGAGGNAIDNGVPGPRGGSGIVVVRYAK